MTFMVDGLRSPTAAERAVSLADPPHCPACGEKMRLSRIEPTRSARPQHHADQVTYECSCGLILAQTIETLI